MRSATSRATARASSALRPGSLRNSSSIMTRSSGMRTDPLADPSAKRASLLAQFTLQPAQQMLRVHRAVVTARGKQGVEHRELDLCTGDLDGTGNSREIGVQRL